MKLTLNLKLAEDEVIETVAAAIEKAAQAVRQREVASVSIAWSQDLRDITPYDSEPEFLPGMTYLSLDFE